MTQEAELMPSVSAIESLERANVDIQISTAKKYPRNIPTVTRKIISTACLDEETAESCFYTLRRGGKSIIGPSVRLAEIAASMYQNLKMGAMIVANDGKKITARGFCQDLENNIAIAVEVDRSIVDKHGKTYSEDMQVVTGNAAKAIALRNAVLKVVPGVIINKAFNEAKKVAVGDAKSLNDRRQAAMRYFTEKLNIPEKNIFAALDVTSIEEVTLKHLEILTGMKTAIKEGTTTIEEQFPDPEDANIADSSEGFKKAEEEKTAPAKKAPKKQAKKEAEKPESDDSSLEAKVAQEESKGWEVWYIEEIIPPEDGVRFVLNIYQEDGTTETVAGMGKSFAGLELNVPIPMKFQQGAAGRVITETKDPIKA